MIKPFLLNLIFKDCIVLFLMGLFLKSIYTLKIWLLLMFIKIPTLAYIATFVLVI